MKLWFLVKENLVWYTNIIDNLFWGVIIKERQGKPSDALKYLARLFNYVFIQGLDTWVDATIVNPGQKTS